MGRERCREGEVGRERQGDVGRGRGIQREVGEAGKESGREGESRREEVIGWWGERRRGERGREGERQGGIYLSSYATF